MCGGHSEAVQDLHGLCVTGVVLVWGLFGIAGSQAACCVWHCRVLFECMMCLCGYGGMCGQGVVEGSPILFGRAGWAIVRCEGTGRGLRP